MQDAIELNVHVRDVGEEKAEYEADIDEVDSRITRKDVTSRHAHFAGRCTAGTSLPVTVAKNGVRHIRLLPSGDKEEVLAVGLACSECFSGSRLAKLLQPGFEYERKVLEDMMMNNYAAPLSIHTSAGVPAALSDFIESLEPHLPWKCPEMTDWCMSLQVEGASAVWAGIDMLLQVNMITSGKTDRTKVAVGSRSYHGPPSTSLGGRSPIWQKANQLKYPVPLVGEDCDEEKLLSEYRDFLDKHSHEIGVLMVEPQWGSSQAGLPWPKHLLKKYIEMAQDRGIKVLADEIMCGLGRHGQGTLFLSEAWDLNPDAVTFGKAVAGGVFPLSGAILKSGRDVLCSQGQTVMQSHTFSGSSIRALMTAAEVIREVNQWLPSVAKLGDEFKAIFGYLSTLADGMLSFQGHGLMWGAMFTRKGNFADENVRARAIQVFKKNCNETGIIPYFVPAGGFMVTPVVDTDVGTIYEIGEKLEEAIKATLQEIEWESSAPKLCIDVSGISKHSVMHPDLSSAECSDHFHMTRACTSCTLFVCRNKRMKFFMELVTGPV